MRIYLKLSPNTEIVPFNYQQQLVGAMHKWLGENELHDEISLYSLSWLSKGITSKGGLTFPNGSELFISSPLSELHQKFVAGIFNDAHINWGMSVQEVRMKVTPDFGRKHRFLSQSPILIKRNVEDQKHQQYIYHDDVNAGTYMTETLVHKMGKANIAGDVSVSFDAEYRNPYIKMVQYRNVNIKASMCPVIVEGDPEAVRFAWEVGVGNSTGIGFGALK